MDILLKAALKEEQIRTRITPTGICPPLEAYVSTRGLVASFPQDLEAAGHLLGTPGFPYKNLPDFVRVFHLPVEASMTLEGLALNASSQAAVEKMLVAMKEAGYTSFPLLCHLQNTPDVWQDLGLWDKMVAVWTRYRDQGVVFYVENSQILTHSPGQTRTFPAWDMAPLAYKALLQEKEIPLIPVFDLCHMVNSGRLLAHLGFWEGKKEDFVFDRLGQYLSQGLGHIHLAYGRSLRQGPDYHGTGFDRPEEKNLLKNLMAYLAARSYRGQIVLETNEEDPMQPTHMLALWADLQDLALSTYV